MLWGWNFDAALLIELLPGVSTALVRCDEDQLRLNAHEFSNLSLSPKVFRLLLAFGVPCYSVSPQGARKLKEHCFPIREMSVRLPGTQWKNLHSNTIMLNIGLDVMMAHAYPQLRETPNNACVTDVMVAAA